MVIKTKGDGTGLVHKGLKRTQNEDFFSVNDEFGLYIVLDGSSQNSGNGELAVRAAEATIVEFLKSKSVILGKLKKDPSQDTRSEIESIIREAFNLASSKLQSMSEVSAAVALILVRGLHAIVAHIGDCRVYLHRRNEVHLLTQDHTWFAEQVRQGVLKEKTSSRSPYSSVLTRALGLGVVADPDVLYLQVLPEDQFILCTDGFSDYLKDCAELNTMIKAVSVSDIPLKLIEFANSRGGKDNIAVVAFQVPKQLSDENGVPVFQKTEIMKHIKLFQYLSFAEINLVLAIGKNGSMLPGKIIFQEGSEGSELYILMRGSAEVIQNGKLVRKLPCGSLFGEMALISHGARSATVKTTDSSDLYIIKRQDFLSLLKSKPELSVKLLWSFCEILNEKLQRA